MKRLISGLFIVIGLHSFSFAADIPDSCQQYIKTVEQLVAQSKDERRNQVLMESVATIQETLNMLDEKAEELEATGKNIPHTDLMLDEMNQKILKRLSQTCDAMHRQIPSDLMEKI